MIDLTEIFGAGNEPSKDWCDANIVSGTYSQTISYGVASTLNTKPSHLVAEGYTYQGWSTTPKSTSGTSQTVNYADGASVTNLTSAGSTITLYGVWTQNRYNITTNIGANGSITPANPTVDWGDIQTFTITANERYKIESITLDGEPINFNPNNLNYVTTYTYTINDVRMPHTLAVTFTDRVKLVIDVQNEAYAEGCYIYHTSYDDSTDTPETVTFYTKTLLGFKFKGWANENGEIVSTNQFETFNYDKNDVYCFYVVMEVAPARPEYVINTAADLLEFVNVATYSENHLDGVKVMLSADIDLTDLDLYKMYGFETFPHLQNYTGYIEYNGYSITKDGQYFDIFTGNLSTTPPSNTDIM